MSEANPILTPFSNKKPEVPPHGVLVARRKDGKLVPLWSGRLSAGEMLFSPYDGYAVVDKRMLTCSFTIQLPSASEPLCFTARIDLQVRVVDPVEVLGNGITDIRGFLQSKLQKVLKGIAAGISIEERRQVEKECQSALDRLRLHGGLEIVDVCIVMELDAQTREDLLKERRIQGNEKDFNAGKQRMYARMLAENPQALVEMLKNDEQRPFLEMNHRMEVIKELKERGLLEDWETQEHVRKWLNQDSNLLVGKPKSLPPILGAVPAEEPPALNSGTDGEDTQCEE